MDGYIAIEREAILTKGSSLRNCIMLPGSTTHPSVSPITKEGIKGGSVGEGGVFENCILGADFRIDLKESEVISASTDESKILIGTGGSDRKYYRIEKNGKTAVLMECGKDDPDFERHIEYTKFLSRYSIPAPDLLEAKKMKCRQYLKTSETSRSIAGSNAGMNLSRLRQCTERFWI